MCALLQKCVYHLFKHTYKVLLRVRPSNIKMFSTRLSPTPCLVRPITMVKLCFCFRGELAFLNCDDICMCVVNKQFELLGFVFKFVYADLEYNVISLTFTAGSVCLCGVCSHMVVLGMSVRLLWYPMWWVWWLR